MQTFNRSLSSVLFSKLLDTIEQATWVGIFTTFAKVFSWLVISMALVNMRDLDEKILALAKWQDFAILKISLAFVLVFYAREIYRAFVSAFYWISENIPTIELPKSEVLGPLYNGIPVVELVDYIFTTPTYSRADFCERFAVARKIFDDLASGLDNVKVFVRGQNNARTLSSEFSRADISAILTRAAENGEIRPLIREIKSGYTHTPSMPEIRERSPSPHFVTRPLHSSNVVALYSKA